LNPTRSRHRCRTRSASVGSIFAPESSYFAYYHQARTHLALDKDAPDLRPIELPVAGKIVQRPEVGGLHHRYFRQAA